MPQIAQAADKVWPGCQTRHIGNIPLFQRIILHGVICRPWRAVRVYGIIT